MSEQLNKLGLTTSGLNNEQIKALYNYFKSINKL